MRGSLALALGLAACGFQIASTVDMDAPGIVDDGGGLAEAWSFDTAAELAAAGHQRVAMAIEPRGSLTPEGYVYGGLLGRGETTTQLWTPADTAWTKLATLTPTGAGLWTGEELTTALDLTQFGIRRNAALRTLWFEGEIFLRAGSELLRIKGGDIAFVEIAAPGTATFEPLLDTSVTSTATVVVASGGWYPVRVGWADGDANGGLGLEIQGSQGGYGPIAPHRLRAPVASVAGTLRTVFYRQMHGGGILGASPIQQIQATPFFARVAFSPPLQGSILNATGAPGEAEDWSARWAGQLYVTVPGQYSVRVDSDDGNRVVLGAAPAAESDWARDDSTANASSTGTATLREGWNDLIVDYSQAYGGTAFGVQIVMSPDPALMGVIPLDRLRPVEPRGERLIARSRIPSNPVAVAEDTGVFSDVGVQVGAQGTSIVTGVDITVVYTSAAPDQLVFRVTHPGGTPVVVRTHPFVSGGRVTTHAFSIDPALVGGPADGMWAVGVADDVNVFSNSNTSIEQVYLTLRTSGGPDQLARTATWLSPIKDLGTQLVKVDAITWDERVPAGTAVELRLRSCDQADCADEASWGEPVVKGMPVSRAQRRYLQAQVTMTSDGSNEAELRSLQIMYRRAAP